MKDWWNESAWPWIKSKSQAAWYFTKTHTTDYLGNWCLEMWDNLRYHAFTAFVGGAFAVILKALIP